MNESSDSRRSFLKQAGAGVTGFTTGSVLTEIARAQDGGSNPAMEEMRFFNVRGFGAKGDGATIDTSAINNAITAAAAVGGGAVVFPAGTYPSYSIHLKSFVSLYLDSGATIVAATTPLDGTPSGGYDAAEPQGAWEPYQDYGHNHWHNSLIWGENIHDFAIFGPGLIWGKGLSRGHPNDQDLPRRTNLVWATKRSL